jgi:hypothetical protein
MANYLISALHIAEFKNTNIIGNGDRWDRIVNNGEYSTLSLIPITNIGLIGHYGVDIMNSGLGSQGVLDITGQVPAYLNTTHGYVNFWSDVLREIFLEFNMHVVHLRGLGGEFIKPGDTAFPERNPVVISKKYTNALVGNAAILKPYHRAFVDNSGQVKLTGPDLAGIDAKYLGSNSNWPVPSLNEEDWIKFGNGATSGFSSGVSIVGGTLRLAQNYASLDSAYKWSNLADFTTNAVTDR